jgi:hypothetical protein
MMPRKENWFWVERDRPGRVLNELTAEKIFILQFIQKSQVRRKTSRLKRVYLYATFEALSLCCHQEI